jgi:hypothetical protein
MMAAPGDEHPQKVQSVHMVRVLLENLAQEGFRLIELALL